MNCESKWGIRPFGYISASWLKIIACVLMFIDHMGMILFPKVMIYKLIGRLAFPIFAFFIAEGCRYTRRPWRRLLIIFLFGLFYLGFFHIAADMLYASVFLTFSVSIALNNLLDTLKRWCIKEGRVYKYLISLALLSSAIGVAYILSEYVFFDYGFVGMLIPLSLNLFYFKDSLKSERAQKIITVLDSYIARIFVFLIGLIFLYLANHTKIVTAFGVEMPYQIWCLASLPIMLLYNGKPGNRKLKKAFYIFYPAHLVFLVGISIVLEIIEKM